MKSILLWIGIAYKTIVHGRRFIANGDREILRIWASDILKLCRVEVECVGKFSDKPFIIMANHESYFDIFAMFYCCDFPLIWFAKKELFKIPVFGRALEKSNAIAVDRQNTKKSSIAIIKALKQRGEKEVMLIFPQGTRKNNEAFKKGGLLIAKKKHIPIVPVKIINSKNILPSNSWKIKSGKIKVRIFDKIDVDNYSEEEIEKMIREKVYE